MSMAGSHARKQYQAVGFLGGGAISEENISAKTCIKGSLQVDVYEYGRGK
jgi:hypothetical protein